MCVDSKGDTNTPVDLWECHQQGGNQVKSHTHIHVHTVYLSVNIHRLDIY
jgi:hypothetical protein